MVDRGSSAFGRWGRLALAVVALAFAATSLAAQGTTGKVEGTVSDPSGQPVAGAQVLVRGTSLGAVTNSAGYYFINNVPAGAYTLMAVYIGFQPNEVRNARVLADQTLTVNFNLQSAVELGTITVTVSENPIVPRDQVTSKAIVTGTVINDMPVDNVRAVLALQPGVVESGKSAGLSIRGGRPGEAAVYVDGALVRSVQTGTQRVNVGTNALEEASITTGALGAEFGEAQSGVISYLTRAGGSRFTSSLSYQTDEMFGDNTSVGYNRVEAAVGGPLVGNLTFYLSGTLDGRKSGFRGIGFEDQPSFVLGPLDTTVTESVNGNVREVDVPTFVQASGSCTADASQGMDGNYGYECTGRRAPYNWGTVGTGQAKLQYTYGSGSRISGTYLYSLDQTRNWNTGYNYQQVFGTRNTSSGFIVNWTQQIARAAERALAFDVNLSYQSDGSVSGALTQEYEQAHRSPSMGWGLSPMDFLIDFDHFSDDDPTDSLSVTQLTSQEDWDQLVNNVRTNQGTRTPYLGRNDINLSQPYRMNPYAIFSGYSTSGYDYSPNLNEERRLSGRANVDFQFDRYNRFKFGADLQSTRVNYYQANLTRQIFMDVYTEAPTRMGFYGEDRLDLGDVVIDLGLRWDQFNSGAYFPNMPGRIFSHPEFDRDVVITDAVFSKAESHSAWSPRVRVSFPVTDQTGFRLSYAHQVQTPNFSTLLSSVNNDLAFTNTNDEFARDVTFGKTVLFEFGIRHAFSSDFVFDVSAYNKDKVADLTFRNQPFLDPATDNREIFVNVLTNLDFGNVRGLDMSLQRRFGNLFSGTLNYTFQVAKNTGSDPRSYLTTTGRQVSSVLGERVEPPQAILPTDDNRTHNITGAFSLTFPSDYAQGTLYGGILRDAGAFLGFRFASGLPYTRTRNTGGGETAPFVSFGLGAIAIEPINSSTLPWIQELDLRLTKGFGLGGFEFVAFGDIRNLLNLTVTNGAYIETGDVRNERHQLENTSPEVERLRNEAGGFLRPDDAITLPSDCNTWGGGPVNCVLIKRAEQRWGDGDGVYTEDEYMSAFNASYFLTNAAYRFYSGQRHVRLGFELRF